MTSLGSSEWMWAWWWKPSCTFPPCPTPSSVRGTQSSSIVRQSWGKVVEGTVGKKEPEEGHGTAKNQRVCCRELAMGEEGKER